MPTDKHELAERIRLTRPEQTVRGLIFNAALKLVEEKAGPDLATALRLPISRKPLVDFFSYPVADFLGLLFNAADAIEPSYPSSEDAVRAIGAAAVGGFFDSGVGKTLITIVGRGDPKRLFSNAPTAYSTAVNYGVREYQSISDDRARLIFRGDMQPKAFHEGLLSQALKAVGCEGTVTGLARSLELVEYEISWKSR